MSDRFGPLQLPASEPSGDPAKVAFGDPLLDTLLAYLQAAVNADTKEIWARIHPATVGPAGEPLPVANVFAHDPDEGSFSVKTLPALFAWRQMSTRNLPLTQEWFASDTTISVLWVPPTASLEKARIRQPFRNAVAKSIARAIERERHPAWVADNDADPVAAYAGSFVLPYLNVAQIFMLDVKPFDLVTGPESKPQPYDALLATIQVRELMVPVKDDYDALADIRGNVNLGSGDDALPIDGFQFVPTLLSVSPDSGTSDGGTAITVTGHQFFDDPDVGELIVTVGGVKCTDVELVDGDTITAVTPPGDAGAQDVIVTLPSGASSAPLVGGFTYV